MRSAVTSDPTAGAVRKRPSPVGPTSRMSFAKIGSNATAPPSSTAKRSSEIAPNSTFVRRMSRTPASTSSIPAAPSVAGARPLRMARMHASDTSDSPIATTYTSSACSAKRRPPTAGATTADS